MIGKLDDATLDEVACYFAALSVPLRLRILDALREGEKNVGELTQQTGATQANVSKHLATLSVNGLVAKTPRGTSVYYRIADPRIYELCEIVCGQVGQRISDRAPWARALKAASAPRPRSRAPGSRRG